MPLQLNEILVLRNLLFFSEKRIVFVTGAGLSVRSGIPLYRTTKEGIWSKNVESVATRKRFLQDPYTWYNEFWRKTHDTPQFKNAQPNEGHFVISQLCSVFGSRIRVITQNIDGLDFKAGCPTENIVEVHGRLGLYRCSDVKCERNRAMAMTLADVKGRADGGSEEEGASGVPLCPLCLRPAMPLALLFDESYDCHEYFQWRKARRWLKEADAIIFVGTSLKVRMPQVSLQYADSKMLPIWSVNTRVQPLRFHRQRKPQIKFRQRQRQRQQQFNPLPVLPLSNVSFSPTANSISSVTPKTETCRRGKSVSEVNSPICRLTLDLKLTVNLPLPMRSADVSQLSSCKHFHADVAPCDSFVVHSESRPKLASNEDTALTPTLLPGVLNPKTEHEELTEKGTGNISFTANGSISTTDDVTNANLSQFENTSVESEGLNSQVSQPKSQVSCCTEQPLNTHCQKIEIAQPHLKDDGFLSRLPDLVTCEVPLESETQQTFGNLKDEKRRKNAASKIEGTEAVLGFHKEFGWPDGIKSSIGCGSGNCIFAKHKKRSAAADNIIKEKANCSCVYVELSPLSSPKGDSNDIYNFRDDVICISSEDSADDCAIEEEACLPYVTSDSDESYTSFDYTETVYPKHLTTHLLGKADEVLVAVILPEWRVSIVKFCGPISANLEASPAKYLDESSGDNSRSSTSGSSSPSSSSASSSSFSSVTKKELPRHAKQKLRQRRCLRSVPKARQRRRRRVVSDTFCNSATIHEEGFDCYTISLEYSPYRSV